MMDVTVRYTLSSKQRFNICICVLVASLVMCASSKPTMGDNLLIDDTNIGKKTDLRTLLTLYILPRLKLKEVIDSNDDIGEDESDIKQQLWDKFNFENLENNNYQDNLRIKRKRFAGMGNLDIMTATLDRQRHRRPTMLSVHRVAMNRLQYLMRQQGRRRK